MSEILQADVMRFMAIIAFCLIAILALVRSVAPAAPTSPADATPADSTPRISDLQVVTRGTTLTARPPAPAALTRPVAPEPPAPEPAAEAPAERPAATPPATAVPAPPEPAATPPAAAQGLTLRFASDQDFLRLVSRGRVQVYAFDGNRVLHLGDDFRFAPAPAPGQVHELLQDTIPQLMVDALRAAGDIQGFRWGIAMPDRMARQVRAFLDQGANGELVIDRYGEVQLHGT